MDSYLKQFLLKNQRLVQQSDMRALYCQALKESALMSCRVGRLSQALESAGIDVIALHGSMPPFYMYDSSITSCPNLERVDTVSRYAFSHCKYLQEVVIPDTIKTIEEGAFAYSYNLEEVQISTEVVHIDRDAFAGTALYSLRLPSSLAKISASICAYCFNLQEVYIPISAVQIDSAAFAECPNLLEINYEGSRAQWRKIQKHRTWKKNSPIGLIHCSDGDIILK